MIIVKYPHNCSIKWHLHLLHTVPVPGPLGTGLPGDRVDGILPLLTLALPAAFLIQEYPAAILAQTLPKSPTTGLTKDSLDRHFYLKAPGNTHAPSCQSEG